MRFLGDDILEQFNFWQELTGKSPIKYLKEFCVESGYKLQFEEEKVDDSELHHPRIFKFTATVENHICSGSGTSKKEARRWAAVKMLSELKLSEDMTGDETDCIVAKVRSNPVGDLDRLTQQLFLPPPAYEMSVKPLEDFPIEDCTLLTTKLRHHICVVRVNEHSARAESNEGKKKAKRAAAEKMLEILRSLHPSTVTLNGNTTTNQSSDPSINHNDQSQSTNCSEAPPTPSKLPSNWSDLVKKAELYSQLCCEVPVQSADSDSDIEKLNSVAEVEYINLEETTVNGEHQCLVRVLSSPLLVFHGLAESHEGAKQAAARRALEYLRDNLHNSTVNSR